MKTRIDSPANPRIVAAIKAVDAHEKMLLEGGRMIEEALDAGVVIEDFFASDISRMTDVKGLRPLRGARSAPLTSVIREEYFQLSAAASAAAAYEKEFGPRGCTSSRRMSASLFGIFTSAPRTRRPAGGASRD
ncbi:MAG TPA: hypothetical protein VKS23_02105, partial [Thermoanaerobaculia bacterium]|nr:hypothetical protein [Thermoanaerobaculia bacterium]